MARVMELFVIVNALAGIATFLGLRFVWHRSKDATKRGFDVITRDDPEEVEQWETSEQNSIASAGEEQSSSPRESSLSSR